MLPVGFGSAVAGGYQISRSLRFNSADSAYLNKTFATNGTGGGITVTFSAWVKRGTLGSLQSIIGADSTAGTSTYFGFNSSNNLEFTVSATTYRVTSGVFRDPSAWYHVVLVWDSSNATDALRCRIYVNGTLQTYSTSPSITLNTVQPLGFARAQGLGADTPTTGARNYFNGYMTEVNFLDGQVPTTTTRTVNGVTETILTQLGEFSSSTGVWTPKAWDGTYGTNGFYLKFADNSNTTAATLGKDSSGNGNNWTPNNFSVTAGAGNDSLVDSPTSYGSDTGVGGEVRGNYCVLNTLSRSISTNAPTPTNGNLEYATPAGVNTTGWPFVLGSIGISSGKWYFEVDITGLEADSVAAFGFAQTTIVNDSDNTDQLDKIIGAIIRNDSVSTGLRSAVLGTYVTRDGADATDAVYQIAIDNDLGKLWIGKANTWYASGNPSAGTNEIGTFTSQSLIPLAMLQKSNTTGDSNLRYNFGQRAFTYTAPSGFKALCTQNLPTPTIGATSTTQANDYFNTVIWIGDGNNPRTVSGVGFQPDFVWAKLRSAAASHNLYDAVRGVGNVLYSDLTLQEANNNAFGYLSAFNSDGFVASAGSTSNAYFNTSSATYVAWNWNAGGSNQTISVGQYSTSPNVPSIASTVRANTTSGFSIVTASASGTSPVTVGHGLGVTPSLIIGKVRDVASTNWYVYSSTISAGDYLVLNSTAAKATSSNIWDIAPTSTVFTVGNPQNGWAGGNSGTKTYVFYCFAPVAGYSAFGSYTGNNAADGTFVYLGFRPEFLMIKSTSASTEWVMMDSARNIYNLADISLYANRDYSEATVGTVNDIDFLSNGFKLRNNTGFVNASQTYIYAAFAETPFKYSLAR